MNLELETLSPVHIGNGKEISPMEYWAREIFIRIDLDGLLKDEEFAPHLETFVQGAAASRYIGQYIPSALLIKHPAYWASLAPEARSYLATNPIVVREFVKTAGRVYIPGSSIKGALLSALFFHVLLEIFQEGSQRQRIIESLRNYRDLREYSRLLDLAFNSFRRPGTGGQEGRFYSWIDVRDTTLGTPDQCLKIFLTRVAGSRSGTDLPIVCEALDAELKFYLELKGKPGFRWDIEELLKISDTFYRLVWGKNNPKESVPEGGYLLRLGQGSSAFATSLLLFKEKAGIGNDIYPLKSPHTQKVVAGDGNLGWILLRPVEEENSNLNINWNDLKQRPVPAELSSTIGNDVAPEKHLLKGNVPIEGNIDKKIPVREAPVGETWGEATITWSPGDQTLIASWKGRKSFCRGKEKAQILVPEELHKKLFDKRKSVAAKVEVVQFEIVKIH